MNKNTLIGSILIAVIVIWWMAVNNANAEAQAAARAAAKAKVTAAQVSKDSANALVVPKKTPEIKAAPVLGGSDESASASSPTLADDSAKVAVKAPAVIKERSVTVETDKFIMTLTNKGGTRFCNCHSCSTATARNNFSG